MGGVSLRQEWRRRRLCQSTHSEDLGLDVLEGLTGAVSADQLGLEHSIQRFGGGVVVGVPFEPTEGTMPSSSSRSV